MQALAIVTFTLTGFVGILFGSDYVDRRLLVRSGRFLPTPPATTDRKPGAAAAEASVTVTLRGVPVELGEQVAPAAREPVRQAA